MSNHNFLIKGHLKKQLLTKEELESKMSEIDEQINKLLLQKAEILQKLKITE